MPENVADVLHGHGRSQQTDRAGMSKRVRAFLARWRNAGRFETASNRRVQRRARAKWSVRGPVPNEDLSKGHGRATVLQVVHEGIADVGQ